MSCAAQNTTQGSYDKALRKLCKATQLKGVPAKCEIMKTEPSIQGKGLGMERFNRPWQRRPLTSLSTLVSLKSAPTSAASSWSHTARGCLLTATLRGQNVPLRQDGQD